MIVTESHVSTAIEYLTTDPHPIALARKDATDAENRCKELYARAFLASEWSVDARKAHAEIDKDYIHAKAFESQAILNLERSRARSKAAEMIIEIWRSENANVRAAERLR